MLAWITLLPLLGAAVVMLTPRDEEQLHRFIGVGTSAAVFVLSLFMLPAFDGGNGGFQLEVNRVWMSSLGVRFHLGVDGISLWLVLLTTFLVPLTLLSPQAMGLHAKRPREFMMAMLVLETGMVGTFLALDLFLFYVFWEVMLIPMYFIIGIWGGERRLYAAIKFVIYTLVGSFLMLVAILYLYARYHGVTGTWSFEYADLSRMMLPHGAQMLCFAAFALAFAIKVPIFPLHTWLPDAHVEAPTGGSVILAAVLLKMGTYGLLRFALPMFPLAAAEAAPLFIGLAVAGIIYGALMAWVQDDVKKLVAYSSVSHLGFVVLGIFTATVMGIQGGIYQMLAHGISTGGLFLAVGLLYDRRHTRRISDFGGLWARMPVFGALFMVIMLASAGLPGLCGFVGELLVLAGTFTAGKSWAEAGMAPLFAAPQLMSLLAGTAIIFAAVYLLTMYQRVMFGPLDKPENKVSGVRDVHGRETFVFGVVVLAALVTGLAPRPILARSEAAVTMLTERYQARLAHARENPGAAAHLFPVLPATPQLLPAPPAGEKTP